MEVLCRSFFYIKKQGFSIEFQQKSYCCFRFVLIYAYLNNIYSSRKIERMLAENICYMWLLGMIRPDYRTIKKYDGRIKHNTLDIIEQIEKNHTIECEEETSAGEMTVSNQHSQSILNPILNSILKFCQSTKKK